MIKTLQKRFIRAAMTAVTVLLLAVVLAISAVFTYQMYGQMRWTAEHLLHDSGMPMTDDRGPMADNALPAGGDKEPAGQAGTLLGGGLLGRREFTRDEALSVRFFLSRFDESGNLESTDTGRISSVSEEEAAEIAGQIYALGRTQGIRDGFYYRMEQRPDESGKNLVCIDISSQRASVLSVLVISTAIALLGWICMLLLVIALSRRAIVPIAENIERQKMFVTNAGHEIKTPLAIILANTEALELYTGQSKWTRNIRSQTIRLSGLMQNLLTLSKMDETGIELPKEKFDLGILTQETVQTFRESAQQRGIPLEVSAQSVEVTANRESIRQLISILTDNAVKYTAEGGKIRVDVVRSGGSALIRQTNTVEKNGEREDPARFFDRFYRSDKARTQKSGGYGIGLSAARAIAQANNAKIRAYYEGEDSIVFEVTLVL